MILNISGRTDIVAFYTPWLLERLHAGFVDVRNPFYRENVSRIYFKDVDLYVFCTKNPWPILPYLHEFQKPILFHITLTPYKKDIEPFVINKEKIIEGIQKVSKILGKENVYVRYDPIFINDTYTVSYHIRAFSRLCELLEGYVSHIIISFIDIYKNVENNARILRLQEIKEEDYRRIGESFSEIGKKHGITLQTCCEEQDFIMYGFVKEECVSKELALSKTNKKFPKWKSRACHCVEMVDIGDYNSCGHLCRYCYANYDERKVKENRKKHDVHSTMLLGKLEPEDKIIIRKDK